MTRLHQVFDEHRMIMRVLGWVVLILLAWYVFASFKSAMDAGGVKADAESTSTTVASPATTVPAAAATTTTAAQTAAKKAIGRLEVVISGSLNMRKSPDQGSEAVASISKGTELSVLSKTGSWYYVESPDNELGYVSSNPRFVKVLSMD